MSEFVEGRVGVALTRNNHAEAAFRKAVANAQGRGFVRFRRRRRGMVAQLPACPLWAIVRVKPGFEFAVADDLSACGFIGYAPHRVVVHDNARLRGSNSKRRKVERDYAIFSGYVFVGCAAGVFVSRRSHEAILDVLGDALGRPGLSQARMDDLNSLHVGAKLHVRCKPRRRPLAVGDLVEAEFGGLDVRGLVTELLKAGVKVDIELFGGLTPVDFPVDRVKPVAL